MVKSEEPKTLKDLLDQKLSGSPDDSDGKTVKKRNLKKKSEDTKSYASSKIISQGDRP